MLTRWPDEPAPWRAEAVAVVATATALAGRLERRRRPGSRSSSTTPRPARWPWPSPTGPGGSPPGPRARRIAAGHFQAARAAAEEVGFTAVARELQALEAGEADLAGRRDDAIALLDDLLDLCRLDEDLFVSVLAHLVRVPGVAPSRRHRAPPQSDLEAAERASLAIEQLWWNGAILRTRAALGVALVDRLGDRRAHWRAAVDFAAGLGALGEVAITLRSAASVAHHLGEVPAAETLFGAAPSSTAITVLPELFPEAIAALEANTPAAPPGASPVDALARARAALGSSIGEAEATPRRRATDRCPPMPVDARRRQRVGP